MNIIAVDDEHPALFLTEKAIRAAVPGCKLESFTTSSEAIAYAQKNRIDAAFLDINLASSASMNGLILAKHLKDIYGKTNIIFVTGYSEYAVDAYSVPASGYLMKPVEQEAVRREIKHLRDPVKNKHEKGVFVKCFGSFSIFIDGKPLVITQEKPKELLAYLVHNRGAAVSTAEIAALLWEDKAYDRSLKSYTRTVISRLIKILRDAGIEDIVTKGWNNMVLNVDRISCDYYEFLNGDVDYLNTYTGEYLKEYSWAEFVVGYLNNRTNERQEH